MGLGSKWAPGSQAWLQKAQAGRQAPSGRLHSAPAGPLGHCCTHFPGVHSGSEWWWPNQQQGPHNCQQGNQGGHTCRGKDCGDELKGTSGPAEAAGKAATPAETLRSAGHRPGSSPAPSTCRQHPQPHLGTCQLTQENHLSWVWPGHSGPSNLAPKPSDREAHTAAGELVLPSAHGHQRTESHTRSQAGSVGHTGSACPRPWAPSTAP